MTDGTQESRNRHRQEEREKGEVRSVSQEVVEESLILALKHVRVQQAAAAKMQLYVTS